MPIHVFRSICFILLAVAWTGLAAGQDSGELQSILIDDTLVDDSESPPPVPTPPDPTPAKPATDVAPANFQADLAGEELPDPDVVQAEPARRRGPIDRSEARSHRLGVSVAGVEAGLKVVGVIVGGPAEVAGMRLGDIIESVDGTSVFSAKELIQNVDSKSGQSVQLNILRDGQPMTATVAVGAQNGTTTYRPSASTSPQRYRRRLSVNAPGVRIESEVGVGAAGTRIRVSPQPFAPPFGPPLPMRRALRYSAPVIPFGPPIGPPPRFIRPGRIGW